ncbi:MAG: hypothetical protein KJ914_11010 [Gammaproteobacteria bacterium]|nr:hypothetical protein [Gammaproteobacteria bacterium]MBU1722419.1 hypothetical protein [Gammaproteobacteria bacterium]MBU2004644.1 hypothetical protein [Gammaproteobacteria bacterium]
MTRKGIGYALSLGLLVVGLGGCAANPAGGNWTKLIDGDKGLENFNRVGAANWVSADGVIQVSAGSKPTYLVEIHPL